VRARIEARLAVALEHAHGLSPGRNLGRARQADHSGADDDGVDF
jgi:hypothetical protein